MPSSSFAEKVIASSIIGLSGYIIVWFIVL
jgi:hypothetical protein